MYHKTLQRIAIIKAIIAGLLLSTFLFPKYSSTDIDFYQLLRFLSCIGFVWIALIYWRSVKKTDAAIAGLCALVFNPFQQLTMFNRDGWGSFNEWFGLFVLVWAVFDYLQLKKLKAATNQ